MMLTMAAGTECLLSNRRYVWLALCLVTVFCCPVTGLSVRFQTTPISRGWTKKNHASSESSDAPGSELFPKDGPYVPSGLSAEEYSKIKKDEAAKQAKMDFASWGPRFRRTERPEGDWMLMPKLWTSGAVSRSPKDNAPIRPRRQRFVEWSRMYLPGFILAYSAIDVLISAVVLFRASQMTVRRALGIALTVLFRRKLVVVAFWKVMASKLLVGMAWTRPAKRYLEWASGKRQWTQRRTFITTMAGFHGVLVIWALLLKAIK